MERNPFVAGKWVVGENFFGRSSLMDYVLNSKEACDWVIGKRRIGKTSFLRQMEQVVNQKQPQTLAIFWDIQGSFDSEGLSESLHDALEDNCDLFEEKWSNFEFDVQMEAACPSILKRLSRTLAKSEMRLMLLIDEAEELINVHEQDAALLSKLRKLFQNTQNMHTVLCSTPRLEYLYKANDQKTSPFLHGFHASYLGHLEEQEADALLAQGIDKPNLRHKIYNLTDGNPFEMQLFAKHFFEAGDFDQIVVQLESNPSLKQVISVNFDLLTDTEKTMVKDIARGRNKLALFDQTTQQSIISKLKRMGYIVVDEDDGLVSLSSYYQGKWLEKQFRESLSFHPVHEVDEPVGPENENAILMEAVSVYKFFLEMAQEGKTIENHNGIFKCSSVDGSLYPDKSRAIGVPLGPATAGLPPWQNAVVETASFLKSHAQNSQSWALFRFQQMAESDPGHYLESDFLDLLLLLAEEARL